jgi:probable LLM family oxidoreductase
VETYQDADGHYVDPARRVADLLEEIELADKVGLDVYGIGEHHRPDYISSAPEILLSAAAARTKRIRLTSAVTVLSSADPVRVYQNFALLDLISQGRAEIMAGRGSFIESFPLFGQSLDDYDDLFEDHLELLLKVRESEKVTWQGKHRASIDNRGVYPRALQQPLPVWIAVGGTPNSVARAAVLGLPLAIAIIGGEPERFAPLVDFYRQTVRKVGRDPAALPISINSHGFIAASRAEAMDLAAGPFMATMSRIGRERGWPPATREQFEASCSLRGANFVGSAEDWIEKILLHHRFFGHQRHTFQLTVGPMPHDKVLEAIELLGTQVAPAVRKEIAARG